MCGLVRCCCSPCIWAATFASNIVFCFLGIVGIAIVASPLTLLGDLFYVVVGGSVLVYVMYRAARLARQTVQKVNT